MSSGEDVKPTETGTSPDVAFAMYFAQEMQRFFKHIQDAALEYSHTKAVPQSIFKEEPASKSGKSKSGKDRVKRKPSAYNIFVRETLDKLKSDPATSGGVHRDLFAQAVSEWSKLSEEEKKEFVAKHEGDMEAAIPGTPPAEAAPASPPLETPVVTPAPATEEDGKKKKKKHHHKDKEHDTERKSEKKEKKRRKKEAEKAN